MSEIERAVIENSKLNFVTKSLARWFRYECNRLRIERRLFREELSKTNDPQHRAELERVLIDNQAEQAELARGWNNSSVRRAIEKQTDKLPNAGQGYEERYLPTRSEGASQIKTSDKSQSKPTHFVGIAAVFGEEADLGYFRERIAYGSFADVLKNPDLDCRFLVNHNADLILGRTGAGLRLWESNRGLEFNSPILEGDALCLSAVRRIDAELWNNCSFTFIVGDDKWVLPQTPGDLDLRIIKKIDKLYDVSVVTYPAYSSTKIGIHRETIKNELDEEFLDDEDEQIIAECEAEREREIEGKYDSNLVRLSRLRQQLIADYRIRAGLQR